MPSRREPSVGIAITTKDRPDALQRAIENHKAFLPARCVFVIVDDGSEIAVQGPRWAKIIRHEDSKGIVAAKNASLRYLMDAGCDHLFLWDDDAWPSAMGWHLPYMRSPEPHLSYQFIDVSGPHKLRDIAIVHQDGQHIAYSGQRGVMLYYKREAIEKVGGFDWVYGRGMFEHGDLANRIYNAGLTTWAFADVRGSDALIHSLDEHDAVQRSVGPVERETLVKRNVSIFASRADTGYTAYVPLVEPENVVLTSLLTEAPDPQRGTRMEASPAILGKWSGSIKGARAVILSDHLKSAPAGSTIERVAPAKENPYFLRWQHVYQWLRAHKEVQWVWATDGTDVEMIREPWGQMAPGRIYIGSEPKTLADEWLLAKHPAKHLQRFIREYHHMPMLNAGLVGGDRETVMGFAHDVIRDWHLTIARRFWEMDEPGSELGDMATVNYVAWSEKWASRVITGPQVHTVFRTEGLGREWAWWKHK